MNIFEKGYVTTELGQIHFRRSGDKGPLVVLLHDSPLDSFVYEPVLPLIGQWARAYAIDTPGYGQSSPPLEALEIPEYASLILDACRKLDENEVFLVGAHTGASIAVAAAHQSPDYVKGISLNGLAIFDEETREEFLRSWAPEIVPDESGDHLIKLWKKYGELMKWSDLGRRQNSISSVLNVWDRYNWAYNAAFRYKPEDYLGEISCVINSFAASGDFLGPATKQAAELHNFPYFEIEDIPGRLPALAPLEFTEVVKKLINSA